MISRRSFLKATVATASGLILPSWVAKAENYIEMAQQPYLQQPPETDTILYATDWGGDAYQLSLGDPYQEPPEMTWRDVLDKTGHESIGDLFGSDDPADYGYAELDDVVDEEIAMDIWVRDGSPDALAFDYLQSMDLGTEFGAPDGVGEVTFYDGPAPGNDSKIVTVPDDLSLSLLQKRLNDLGESVLVKVGS